MNVQKIKLQHDLVGFSNMFVCMYFYNIFQHQPMLRHGMRAHMHEQNLSIMLVEIGGDDFTKVKEYQRKQLAMKVSLFLYVHKGRKERARLQRI